MVVVVVVIVVVLGAVDVVVGFVVVVVECVVVVVVGGHISVLVGSILQGPFAAANACLHTALASLKASVQACWVPVDKPIGAISGLLREP